MDIDVPLELNTVPRLLQDLYVDTLDLKDEVQEFKDSWNDLDKEQTEDRFNTLLLNLDFTLKNLDREAESRSLK